MISIAVICNDLGDREAVIAILRKQDDFHIACVGEDGFDLIQSAMTQSPDVAIMDFHLRDIEGPDLAPIIKRRSPSTSLIALCSQRDRGIVGESLKAGISGCLTKQRVVDNLVPSVRSVYYGGLYFRKPDLDAAPNCFALCAASPESPGPAIPVFSPTELGILRGISSGQTDHEIAAGLNITIGTLRNCVSHAKKKTGLRNRTQVAMYALLNGMIKPEKLFGEPVKPIPVGAARTTSAAPLSCSGCHFPPRPRASSR